MVPTQHKHLKSPDMAAVQLEFAYATHPTCPDYPDQVGLSILLPFLQVVFVPQEK